MEGPTAPGAKATTGPSAISPICLRHANRSDAGTTSSGRGKGEGSGTRFGGPTQRILLESVLDRVRASAVDDVVVVLGAYDVETEARVIRCPDWERGHCASLRCGLAALPPESEAVVVMLADGPDLDPRAVDRVVQSWRSDGGEVVAASYGGMLLHPVLLARAAWERTRWNKHRCSTEP